MVPPIFWSRSNTEFKSRTQVFERNIYHGSWIINCDEFSVMDQWWHYYEIHLLAWSIVFNEYSSWSLKAKKTTQISHHAGWKVLSLTKKTHWRRWRLDKYDNKKRKRKQTYNVCTLIIIQPTTFFHAVWVKSGKVYCKPRKYIYHYRHLWFPVRNVNAELINIRRITSNNTRRWHVNHYCIFVTTESRLFSMIMITHKF